MYYEVSIHSILNKKKYDNILKSYTDGIAILSRYKKPIGSTELLDILRKASDIETYISDYFDMSDESNGFDIHDYSSWNIDGIVERFGVPVRTARHLTSYMAEHQMFSIHDNRLQDILNILYPNNNYCVFDGDYNNTVIYDKSIITDDEAEVFYYATISRLMEVSYIDTDHYVLGRAYIPVSRYNDSIFRNLCDYDYGELMRELNDILDTDVLNLYNTCLIGYDGKCKLNTDIYEKYF